MRTSVLSKLSAPIATIRKASARRAVRGLTSAGGSGIRRQAEAVPGAEDRLDDARVPGVPFDLAAEVLDVRVDGALISLELVAPYAVDQLVAGVDAARGTGQGHEDPPLGRRQLDGGAPHPDHPLVLVDDQLAVPERGLTPPSRSRRPRTPPVRSTSGAAAGSWSRPRPRGWSASWPGPAPAEQPGDAHGEQAPERACQHPCPHRPRAFHRARLPRTHDI